MGPFLRGFCSELVKTAEGSVGQPGYGYSSRENVPSAPTPFPGRGERGQAFHYRKIEEPWQPSPKPPAPIDTRKPEDPYPKAKSGKGKSTLPGRQGHKPAPPVQPVQPPQDSDARFWPVWSKPLRPYATPKPGATPEDVQRADRLKALLPPEPPKKPPPPPPLLVHAQVHG